MTSDFFLAIFTYLKVSIFQKDFLMSLFGPKTNEIFLRISAVASKKRLNQKTSLYNFVK